MKKLIVSTLVAAALAASSSAMAGATMVIASDNFQSYASGGGIAGSNSGSGGWSGAWMSNQTTATGPTIVDQSGDKSLQFNTDNDKAAYRNLNSAVSGNVLIRFEFQYNGAALGTNDFLGLWFGTPDGPNIGLKANCGGAPAGCTDDAFARLSLGTNQMLGNSNLQSGKTYTLLGHLYKGVGSTTYNQFDAWLDPSAAEMSSLTNPQAHSSAAAGSGIGTFSQMGFRTATLNGGGVNVLVDDLELSVIPEPASIALFGTAMLAMAGLRRRRQK